MGNLPVLKPTEVVAILQKLGSLKLGNEVPTSSIATQTGAARLCRFTKVEIYRPSCYDKSLKMLDSLLRNSSATADFDYFGGVELWRAAERATLRVQGNWSISHAPADAKPLSEKRI